MITATRRRLPIAIAAAALTVPVLAGCAGSDSSSTTGSAGTVDGSTITIATVAQLKDQFQAYADAYMAEYPDRTVKIDSTTDDFAKYIQQLATERISGSLPDLLFNVDAYSDTLADANVTLDLAPGLAENKAGLNLDDFIPQFVGQYRPATDQDKITGLPVSADSTALVYNKTLFDEVGVAYPTADWTWADYIAAAEEIQTKSGGSIYGTVNPLGDGSSPIGWGPILTATGATIYDADTNTTDIGSDAADAGWQLLIDLYGTGSVAYSTTTDDPAGKFESGTVAMGIASRGSLGTYREALADYDWDVTETPTVDGSHISGGGSYGLSISQTSQNQDAAWAFLGWFYDADKGLALAQTSEGGGIIPPTQDGLENGTWKDIETPANIAVFAQTANDAVLLTQMPGDAGSTLNEAVKTATQEVLLNGKSVKEAFQTAEDTVNAALAESK